MKLRSFTTLVAACLALTGGLFLAAGASAGVTGEDPVFEPAPAGEQDRTLVEPNIAAGLDRGVRVSSLPGGSVPGPSKRRGTYVARILIETAVRQRPGAGATEWSAGIETKWSGSAQRLMVLASRKVDGQVWLKVRLPVRPNRASGWIPRDRTRLSLVKRFIVIDRSSRLLRIYRKGHVVARFKVVIGAPSTPTPVGLFALYDRVRQPDPKGFIGPWAVPLTAHSEQLRRFDGGPGLVALHGRDGASFFDPLGSARSHGCVRMNNSRIRLIVRTTMGTAVQVRN